MNNTSTKKQNVNIKKLCCTAMLGALSGVLLLFNFPLPFMPPFYSMDFAAIPEILGAFLFGPVSGLIIIFIKIAIKLLMQGTITALAGEITNIILSIIYVIPAALLYQHKKTKKTACVGLIVDTLLVVLFSVPTNIFISFPIYGLSMEAAIEATKALNPLVTSSLAFITLGLVPFNLIKYSINSIVVILIYKHLSKVIKRIINE